MKHLRLATTSLLCLVPLLLELGGLLDAGLRTLENLVHVGSVDRNEGYGKRSTTRMVAAWAASGVTVASAPSVSIAT